MVSDELLAAKGFTTIDGGKSWSLPQAYPDDWAAFLNEVRPRWAGQLCAKLSDAQSLCLHLSGEGRQSAPCN
jgi:hypothetical protein